MLFNAEIVSVHTIDMLGRCLHQSDRTSWLLAHKISHVHYEPLGVVAAIVSWNYVGRTVLMQCTRNQALTLLSQPFHNLLSPVIAALMSGNAIVVKTSESVAWSSSHFSQAIRSSLEACGHDPDVVQVLVGCEAEAARSLTGSQKISHLTFIGSDKVGKEVARDAAENLLPVTLELGGKVRIVYLLCEALRLKTLTPFYIYRIHAFSWSLLM